MTISDPPIWSLDEHMAAGASAIGLIEAAQQTVAQVCHHFDEINPVDPEVVSVEATYRPLCDRFSDLGVTFAPDRLEAWENAEPSKRWLEERIPAIFAAAAASCLIYRGWTWEPIDRQPIGASDIEVINNRTA